MYGLTIILPEMFPNRFPTGFFVGCYGPSADKSRIIFRRLKDRYDRKALALAGIGIEENNGNTFKLSNGSFAKAITASPTSVQEGDTYHLIIVDEAPHVESEVLKRAIFPTTTATGGTRVLIGTPNNKLCYFYEALNRLQGSPDCFVFDVDRVIKDRQEMFEATGNPWHLAYEKSFLKELRRRGKDDEILSQYYLRWMLERGMFASTKQLLRCALPYDRVKVFEHPVFAGWDIAKTNDRSILTIATLHAPCDMMVKVDDQAPPFLLKRGEQWWDVNAERYHAFVLDWAVWEGTDYPVQENDVTDILVNQYPNLEALTIDATGGGIVVVDHMRQKVISDRVNPFSFGQGGQKLSELWGDLLHVVSNKGLFHFPMGKGWDKAQGFDVPEMSRELRLFIDEMLGAEKVYRGNYLKVEAPQDGKSHDDFPASLALANYGTRNRATLHIELIKDSADPTKTVTVDGLWAPETQELEYFPGTRQIKPFHYQGKS